MDPHEFDMRSPMSNRIEVSRPSVLSYKNTSFPLFARSLPMTWRQSDSWYGHMPLNQATVSAYTALRKAAESHKTLCDFYEANFTVDSQRVAELIDDGSCVRILGPSEQIAERTGCLARS